MTTYNGYANKATWMICLWLNNEPGTYEQARAIVAVAESDYEAADELREYVWSLVGDVTTITRDLVGVTIGQVDWKEVVDAFKEE